jgi:hypothetical protein
MKLNELFDKEDHGGKVAVDRKNGYDPVFEVTKQIGGREITFTVEKDLGVRYVISFSEDSEQTESGEKSNHGLTGSGNEIEVMSFVMACMREFIQKFNPKAMEFSAFKTEQSRVQLYKRMIKRFANDFDTQEVEKAWQGRVGYESTVFLLTRKDK